MNRLLEPIYSKKSWGHEIIWGFTNHYMAKTIEIDPYKITNLIVYEKKEKTLIVAAGVLSLAIGKCCDEKDLNYEELPEGWSRHIPAGMMHRYGATDKPLRLIEISSPEMDEAILLDDMWVLEHE